MFNDVGEIESQAVHTHYTVLCVQMACVVLVLTFLLVSTILVSHTTFILMITLVDHLLAHIKLSCYPPRVYESKGRRYKQ